MIRFDRKIQGTRSSDDYATPVMFYNRLHSEFNFELDPCPYKSDFDGLQIKWIGSIYCNPPYSNVAAFINKGVSEIRNGNAKNIVYLLPVRTDVKYWHDIILKYADEIRFIKGRLNFNESKTPAPMPCCLVIFNKMTGACKINTIEAGGRA